MHAVFQLLLLSEKTGTPRPFTAGTIKPPEEPPEIDDPTLIDLKDGEQVHTNFDSYDFFLDHLQAAHQYFREHGKLNSTALCHYKKGFIAEFTWLAGIYTGTSKITIDQLQKIVQAGEIYLDFKLYHVAHSHFTFIAMIYSRYKVNDRRDLFKNIIGNLTKTSYMVYGSDSESVTWNSVPRDF